MNINQYHQYGVHWNFSLKYFFSQSMYNIWINKQTRALYDDPARLRENNFFLYLQSKHVKWCQNITDQSRKLHDTYKHSIVHIYQYTGMKDCIVVNLPFICIRIILFHSRGKFNEGPVQLIKSHTGLTMNFY